MEGTLHQGDSVVPDSGINSYRQLLNNNTEKPV